MLLSLCRSLNEEALRKNWPGKRARSAAVSCQERFVVLVRNWSQQEQCQISHKIPHWKRCISRRRPRLELISCTRYQRWINILQEYKLSDTKRHVEANALLVLFQPSVDHFQQLVHWKRKMKRKQMLMGKQKQATSNKHQEHCIVCCCVSAVEKVMTTTFITCFPATHVVASIKSRDEQRDAERETSLHLHLPQEGQPKVAFDCAIRSRQIVTRYRSLMSS